MSITNQNLRRQIEHHNRRLDSSLQRRVGISLETYKVIKNLTQLFGAAAGVYSMHLGADPMLTFALIAGIITGPEAIEYVLTHDPEN